MLLLASKQQSADWACCNHALDVTAPGCSLIVVCCDAGYVDKLMCNDVKAGKGLGPTDAGSRRGWRRCQGTTLVQDCRAFSENGTSTGHDACSHSDAGLTPKYAARSSCYPAVDNCHARAFSRTAHTDDACCPGHRLFVFHTLSADSLTASSYVCADESLHMQAAL